MVIVRMTVGDASAGILAFGRASAQTTVPRNLQYCYSPQVFFKAEFLGEIYLTAFLKGFSLTATRTRKWAPSPPVTYLIFASNFISHCAKYTKSLVESVLGPISCLSLPASIAIAWPISLADCT